MVRREHYAHFLIVPLREDANTVKDDPRILGHRFWGDQNRILGGANDEPHLHPIPYEKLWGQQDGLADGGLLR